MIGLHPTLDELGLQFKTDKASSTHDYLKNYESYLHEKRFDEFTLLELGVGSGGSIKMWRTYFPKAKIFGVDINPDCAGEGIFIGDATDENFMNSVFEQIGEVNVLVEDSGHVGHETIKIFQMLFKKIKSGALMFIEDTSVWFNNHYSGENKANGRTQVYNFFSDLAYHVEVAGRAMTGNYRVALETQNPTFDKVPEYSEILESIHIHQGLWIFKRR